VINRHFICSRILREKEEVRTKGPIGILIYGYNRENALQIEKTLDRVLNDSIFVISASGKSNRTIADILDSGPDDFYEDRTDKMIMFLAFNKEQIDAALNGFPSPEIERPIFCGLTAQNIQWPLNRLFEHLKDEHRQWTRDKLSPKEDP
jgi:hypothetical protein